MFSVYWVKKVGLQNIMYSVIPFLQKKVGENRQNKKGAGINQMPGEWDWGSFYFQFFLIQIFS